MEWININLPDGRTIQLTNWNSHVFIHSDEYKAIDHVFVRIGEGELGMFIFDNRELIRAMMDSENYGYTWSPFPSDNDVQAYERYKTHVAESEVQKFHEELEGDINWDELN